MEARRRQARSVAMTLSLDVAPHIEQAFRAEVGKRLGLRKGNLKRAMEEAIVVWIAFPEFAEAARSCLEGEIPPPDP